MLGRWVFECVQRLVQNLVIDIETACDMLNVPKYLARLLLEPCAPERIRDLKLFPEQVLVLRPLLCLFRLPSLVCAFVHMGKV